MTAAEHLPASTRGRLRARCLTALVALASLTLTTLPAAAQARLEREGLVLYWGLVPAEVLAERHPAEEMHGGTPKGGGQVHHLVIALFDAGDGRRIGDAVVRAQLSELGVVDAPPKYLLPMPVNGMASYGQLFSTVKEGPYRFRVSVKLSDRPGEVVFAVSAWSPHRPPR